MSKFDNEDVKVSILPDSKSLVRVVLRNSVNQNIFLTIEKENDRNVSDLREKVKNLIGLNEEIQGIKFIFKGRVLEDSQNLSQYSS